MGNRTMSSPFTDEEVNRIVDVKEELRAILNNRLRPWANEISKYLVVTDSVLISKVFHGEFKENNLVVVYILDVDNVEFYTGKGDWSGFVKTLLGSNSRFVDYKVLKNTEILTHHNQMLYAEHTVPERYKTLYVPTHLKTREELVENCPFLHARPSYVYATNQLFISSDMYDSIARKVTVRMNDLKSLISNNVPQGYDECTPDKFLKTMKTKRILFKSENEKVALS